MRLLIEKCQSNVLKEDQAGCHPDGSQPARVPLVAPAYPFPDIGNRPSLIFHPVFAWFYGSSIEKWEAYPALLATGLPGFILPSQFPSTFRYLLEIAELPAYFSNLWVASGVSRNAVLVESDETMHLMNNFDN